MIAPEYRYAQNKQRECGGCIEEWVDEFNKKFHRLTEILEERGLMKDVHAPMRSDMSSVRHPTSLVKLGLVKNFPQQARGYGLETVMGFYDRIIDDNPHIKQWTADILQISKEQLCELQQRVESLLGEEYISIRKELKKY